jgi:UDP-glucose 4-epimerase
VFALSRNADAHHLPLGYLPHLLVQNPPDVLIHMAWSTVPSSAESNPGTEWYNDLPLLSEMLRDVDARRIQTNRPTHLVFFSSCAVYGEPTKPSDVLDEHCKPSPIGWYARGKAHAEQLIEAFSDRGNPAAVLRVTNPYGFAQDARCLQGVIPALVRAAVTGNEFSMWGGGDAVKDYLHISDLCRAVECVVRSRLQGTYNVAAGRSVSLGDLVGMVEEITNRTVECRAAPAAPWDVRSGRYSHQALTAATGWKPSVDLAEGLRALVRLLAEVLTP